MSGKIIAAVLVLSALTLGGCSQDIAEAAGQVPVTEADLSEITSAYVSESAAKEGTSAEKEAETAEKDVFEIKVTPADEVYEVYPKRIIYPEKTETNITAEKAEITEGFEKGGRTIVAFSAEYPVFSGGDEAVMKKINDSVKAYIDGIYSEEKESAAKYTLTDIKEDAEYDFPYGMCGFYWQRAVTGGAYYGFRDEFDVNGNILSVYFEDYSYGAGAAHGSGTPVPVMFDLRTGERVFFSGLIEDADGLSEALSKALFDYRYAYTYTNSAYRSDDADKYAEYNGNRISEGFRDERFVEFGMNDEGNYIAAYCPADDRVIIRDGCVCIYLAPYEYGNHADGIRRADAPISDILPFLNEEGRSLLEGYVSAESEPANVIEYKGKRYFDNIFPVLTLETFNYHSYWMVGEFPPILWEFTDSDYEFMGLFPDVGRIELHGCSNIDFEKLSKIKNIDNITELELEYCEFGDISPLAETNINYIGGKGSVIPFEQAEVFRSREGNYIGYYNVGPEYVEYKGHTFALTGNGIEISDRELDEIDYEFIAAQEEIWRLEFVRCALDYGRLAELGNFRYLALKECENIDFAAIARIDFIDSIRLDHCFFDDISPLYGSGITWIDGEGERGAGQCVSNMQMQEFHNSGGFHIDSYLIE